MDINKYELKVLTDCYVNDLVDSIDYNKSYLYKMVKKGLLLFRDITPNKIHIFWLSKEGLNILKENNLTYGVD